ncbi:MAG TPA: hypothetical protein VNL35_11600 [Chloroflexota bacterium]|nr:hypothetical protein [Chloroflexota bacterium]
MALREPVFSPDPDMVDPRPQTEAALDGPGHGPGSRPPTTGMLPHGDRSEGQVRVLLAADTGRDRALVGAALFQAERNAGTTIDFERCSFAEAPLRARVLLPTLIVIEDRSSWLHPGRAVNLCRGLRAALSWHTTVIVLSSRPRSFRKRSLRNGAADIVLPASVQEPALAAVFEAFLPRRPEGERR